MTARKAAHSLQRAKGALASGFATVDLHHARGHDLKSRAKHRVIQDAPLIRAVLTKTRKSRQGHARAIYLVQPKRRALMRRDRAV